MNNENIKRKKQEYLNNYKKQNTKIFKADLKIEEAEDLEVILKEAGMNKAQFVRKYAAILKEELIQKNKDN